jgi:exodeoxyribonuclease V alpha subunit
MLKVVHRLAGMGERSFILTLTGKAALRLKNNDEGVQGIDAKSIDKFLTETARLGDGKLVVPNLIIDEMSMVDLDKLAEVLNRINIQSPYFRRLILVGDESQLPPIGAGKVFEDILEYLRTSGPELREHWAHLGVNCRSALGPDFLEFCRVFSY